MSDHPNLREIILTGVTAVIDRTPIEERLPDGSTRLVREFVIQQRCGAYTTLRCMSPVTPPDAA